MSLIKDVAVFTMPEGDRLALSDVAKGSKRVVELWTPGCDPCSGTLNSMEIVAFSKYFEYAFIAANCTNLKTAKSSFDEVGEMWLHLNHVNVEMASIGHLKKRFGVTQNPHFFILDAKGHVVKSTRVLNYHELP